MNDATFLIACVVATAILGLAYLPVVPFVIGGIYLVGKLVLKGVD